MVYNQQHACRLSSEKIRHPNYLSGKISNENVYLPREYFSSYCSGVFDYHGFLEGNYK